MINIVPTHSFFTTELQIGEFLGAGGFCIVSEVSDINLKTTSTNDTEEKAKGSTSAACADDGKVGQDRNFIATNVFRDDSARYAIKKLSPHLRRKPPGTFLSGIIDLAMEVKYLAVVQVRLLFASAYRNFIAFFCQLIYFLVPILYSAPPHYQNACYFYFSSMQR